MVAVVFSWGAEGLMASPRRWRDAALLAVIGLAVFASPAAGAFSAPVDLGTSAVEPQVATDTDGDSALTWVAGPNAQLSGSGHAQARTLSAAGTLGSTFELGQASDTTDRLPRVATDAAGDSVFMWVNGIFLEGRRLSAGGTLGPGFQINSNSNSAAPDVATDLNGDTVFTWVNTGGFSSPRVQARTMTRRGVLGPLRNVSPFGEIGSHPQVATDDTGDSVITWVLEDGVDGDNDIVQARTLTANGSLGPIMDLSAAGGRAFAPQVASDADGDTIFTWLRFDGRRDLVQARPMTAAGVLQSTVNITTSGPSARDPQVATDTNGDSVFTWERFEGGNDRVQARTRSAAGVLGAITNLSALGPPGGDAFAPQVASADSGASAFTWLRFDGTNDRVQERPMTAAGVFGGTNPALSPAGDAETPQIAMAATTGKVIVTWELAGVIQASIGP
jgi:hypothetical protein